MSYSALVSTSKARIRSSDENFVASAARRSRSASAAISGSRPARRRSSRREGRASAAPARARPIEVRIPIPPPARQVRRPPRHPRGNRIRNIEQQVAAHQPEHRRHIVGGDLLAGERDHLVERTLRVAHAAVARSRDEHQRAFVDLDLFRRGDRAELIGDLLQTRWSSARTPAIATGSSAAPCRSRSSPS